MYGVSSATSTLSRGQEWTSFEGTTEPVTSGVDKRTVSLTHCPPFDLIFAFLARDLCFFSELQGPGMVERT
jgi:hypothetical protein